jgi:hypothetical protein
MNKKAKKLTLARETLRTLAWPALGPVRGAGPNQSSECMTAVCPTAEHPCEITPGQTDEC